MAKPSDSRRDFLLQGGVAAAALVAGGSALAEEHRPGQEKAGKSKRDDAGYPRYEPGRGGPVGSPTDRGKLVPGLRESGLPPVPLTTPDLPKLPFKLVDGVKEFHLRPMPVAREFLPGQTFHFYGYNGSMPGPTIEVNQGDRVRVVVHNELPEATTVHWHGLEGPNNMDGIPFVTQKPIAPGETMVYEFTVHQATSLIYHAHLAMQEAIGMVGMFVSHPRTAYDPAVDQDFGLLLQQFSIDAASNITNTISMDWNYLTINGRCGPLTTPLVVKLGHRIRIRLFNFSTLHQHPIHFHGHTGWLTGTEGGRIPESAWIPCNTARVGIGEVREIEFVANNPGDWVMHCHMFHHMMNHMVSQVGPHIRGKSLDEHGHVAGFPQNMEGMTPMAPAAMRKILGRREVAGMREGWHQGVAGMFTVIRVLPEELYNRVTSGDGSIPAGASVFPHA
ncbi:MAG: copper oxidase [Pirellulaceae bacterium]